MITNLSLKNFTAFKELDIEFSPKINVIIGENGTGKTQLLKAAYILNKAASSYDSKCESPVESFLKTFTQALLGAYRPDRIDQVRQLQHRGSRGDPILSAIYSSGQEFGVRLRTESAITPIGAFASCENPGNFLPAKEIISFLEGMFRSYPGETESDRAKHLNVIECVFDDTYMDLARTLVSTFRLNAADSKAQWLREELVNKIEGRFVFAGPILNFQSGRYEQYKNKHASNTYFSPIAKHGCAVGLAAEGHRKIGILQQLLQIEAIGSGANGPLFWDEPEANMNPKLMKTVVDVLLELSRNGQQVILATHDYVLLKWLDLLMDTGKEDHVRFHLLRRDDATGDIAVESTDSYSLISKSAISDTFAELYDADVERALG
jgi:ABC-type lipoprotein export system ATPase subunit